MIWALLVGLGYEDRRFCGGVWLLVFLRVFGILGLYESFWGCVWGLLFEDVDLDCLFYLLLVVWFDLCFGLWLMVVVLWCCGFAF